MKGDSVFGPNYAASYDLFYADKDYAAECDLLQKLFARHSPAPVRRILDLGCGTGRHACLLAERGHAVVGVDRAPDMLRTARERAEARHAAARFVEGDIRDISVGESFDAVLMMFAVLGYQTSDDDVATVLANARRHLTPGGILAFDVWYGPAVIAQSPEPRWRLHQTSDGGIVRYSRGMLQAESSLCAVDIEVWSLTPGRPNARHARERHEMRFFSRPELETKLQDAGFQLLELVAFPEADQQPDESTWNVLACAQTTTGS